MAKNRVSKKRNWNQVRNEGENKIISRPRMDDKEMKRREIKSSRKRIEQTFDRAARDGVRHCGHV